MISTIRIERVHRHWHWLSQAITNVCDGWSWAHLRMCFKLINNIPKGNMLNENCFLIYLYALLELPQLLQFTTFSSRFMRVFFWTFICYVFVIHWMWFLLKIADSPTVMRGKLTNNNSNWRETFIYRVWSTMSARIVRNTKTITIITIKNHR